MAWRNCKCPLNLAQDGVCGCPQFWERKSPNNQALPNNPTTPTKARVDTLKSPSPSSTPPGPPRETCFFWYHGTCHRGADCKFAHESHVTWPMMPPPGYIHYEKCNLPLCPLRQDLVDSRQAEKKKTSAQMGGQLDGAALSVLRRSTPIEVEESDADGEYDSKDTDDGTSNADSDGGSQDYSDQDDEGEDQQISPSSFAQGSHVASLNLDESEDTDTETTYTEAEERCLSSITFISVHRTLIETSTDDEGESSDPGFDSSNPEEDQEDVAPSDDVNYLQPVIEVSSSDDDNGGLDDEVQDHVEDHENLISIIDPSSRALNGSYSSASDSGNDDEGHEAALEDGVVHPTPQGSADTTCDLPASDGIDYVDLTCYTPPHPLSSDAIDSPLLSLSHPGTLKRKRTTSPNHHSDSNKRKKREITPNLDEFVSIQDRKRHTNHWDVNSVSGLTCHPTSSPPAVSPTLDLPRKPLRDTTQTFRPEDHHPLNFNPRSHPPTAPRAFGGSTLICFYWYHKGHCRPRRGRNGRPVRCAYAHTLDIPYARVSLPPGIDRHDPECALPLCPVRLGRSAHDVTTNITGNYGEPQVIDEAYPSPTYNATPVDTYSSSSSRDGIADAQTLVRRPKVDGNQKYQQLPQLTGAKRQPFEAQKKSIEKREHDINIKPNDLDQRRPIKRPNKRERRQRKLQKRQANELNYGDEVKETELRRRSRELFEADTARGGRVEKLDPEAELYKESWQPIAGFADDEGLRDVRDDMEDRKLRAERALSMVQQLKDAKKASDLFPLRAAGSARRGRRRAKGRAELEHDEGRKKQKSKFRVLVDYELPAGEERLPWDTDYVRRIFGEIE